MMVYEGSIPNDILNRMATDNLAHQLNLFVGLQPYQRDNRADIQAIHCPGTSVLPGLRRQRRAAYQRTDHVSIG